MAAANMIRWLPLLGLLLSAQAFDKDSGADRKAAFQTSDRCIACHNGLSTPSGMDVSIGSDWRTSLMANSSRDPYWQAGIRRESIDHPESKAAIEDECSSCHMPIARYHAKVNGELGQVFSHFPLMAGSDKDKEAADGVSCSVCHQIMPDGLGKPETFNGQFVVNGPNANGVHAEYGPFDIDPGLMQVMRTSTTGYEPTRGDHIRSAELCASCHTLITKALGPDGKEIGSLYEQVPYQEWLHSDYRTNQSCQSCHMPLVEESTAITRVLGVKREGMRRHQFVAANFVLQRMFNRYNGELNMTAPPHEFATAAERTIEYLQNQAAKIAVSQPQVRNGRLEAEVSVDNLGGHKLPTAYPSRRAWIHFVVRDKDGKKVFESGALKPDGSIQGNDNDSDAKRYEPHYTEIRSADQVEIYESIMKDSNGAVTTGLLHAVGYSKDNRLLPHGFNKSTATPDIAVIGDALQDPAFTDRGHKIRYSVDVSNASGPFTVESELWYQPIGFRWANNLKNYDTAESHRFNGYYDSMGQATATLLVKARAEIR